MSSYNKVILAGHLTRDPELKFTPKGTAVSQVGLAINRNWTNEAGEKKEEVTFIDITVFGKTAENTAQYCVKGSLILVDGHLRLDVWEDKESRQKRTKLVVVADAVHFMGGGKEENGRKPTPRASARKEAPPQDSDDDDPL